MPNHRRASRQKLHTGAKQRKPSSRQWLERHINDPYVQQAQQEGYRCRAVFKLEEINKKFRLLGKNHNIIIDLGAAPGGWSQYVRQAKPNSRVIAVDLLEMEPLNGVEFLQMDFSLPQTQQAICDLTQGGADIILSDIAPSMIGHAKADTARIYAVLEVIIDFVLKVLQPGGHFVCKVFQGGTPPDLLKKLKGQFVRIKHFKPSASRAESSEIYLVALGRKSVNITKNEGDCHGHSEHSE